MSFRQVLLSVFGCLLLASGAILSSVCALWAAGSIAWSLDISVLFLVALAATLLFSGFLAVYRRGALLEKCRFLRFYFILNAAGLAVVCFAQAQILLGFCSDIPSGVNVIVVPGARLQGTYPSLVLQGRLNAAMKVYDENPEAVFVVCGGQGDDEAIPEAEAMRNWLLARGVRQERVIAEDRSTNTYQNLSNAAALLTERDLSAEEMVIVSSDYHIYRCLMIAKRLGLRASGYGSPLAIHLRPFAHMRETVSVLREWVWPET